MNKKLFWIVTLFLLVAGTFAEAQQAAKVWRIGRAGFKLCITCAISHSGSLRQPDADSSLKSAPERTDHLLVTASAASFLSEITSVGYATTKYAAFGFGEWLAFSYRGRGLKVAVPGPVWGPMIKDIPYLHEGAITPDEAADRVLEGLAAGKFLITTHPQTQSQIRQKAADVDAYVDFLVGFREHTLSLKGNDPA